MADIDSGPDTSGFKLFGTTIPVQVRPVKEEKVAEEGHGTTQKRPEKIIPCPRCKSMDTKFCYFNNYNVNQPRHFCKGCQRYWTAGGTLRNVPIGAGRRKTKPTYQAPIGFSEDFIFNGSMVNEFDLEGMVEQWSSANPEGSFRRVFPAKRRSIGSAGQLC